MQMIMNEVFTAVFSNGTSLRIEARHNGEAIKAAFKLARINHTTLRSVTK
jgi:hypothetical protein